jgi:hypothetical protein
LICGSGSQQTNWLLYVEVATIAIVALSHDIQNFLPKVDIVRAGVNGSIVAPVAKY